MRHNKTVIRQSKPETRRYSVLPARAVQDDDLHYTTLRLLGAICLHTNKYGICFPSRITLGRHISRHPKTVSVHITRLIKAGYIRKLKKRGYQIPQNQRKAKYATNRYQVLYDGEQTKMPSKEQFYAPRPKIAEEYPEESVIENSKGLKGGKTDRLTILSLSQAYCAGISRSFNQLRLPENSTAEAKILAENGITAEQVLEHTLVMCEELKKRNKPAPLNLLEVAKYTGLI